jgi:hypothetical protein
VSPDLASSTAFAADLLGFALKEFLDSKRDPVTSALRFARRISGLALLERTSPLFPRFKASMPERETCTLSASNTQGCQECQEFEVGQWVAHFDFAAFQLASLAFLALLKFH